VGIELRGHFYQSTGAYGLAIADFSRAIALAPGTARAWNSRCWTRVLANKELGAALADCDRAIALNPRYASAFDSRGLAKLVTGDATAQRDLAQARLLDRNIEARFAAMGFRLKANGPSGA